MVKTTEYKIVYASSAEELMQLVNERLENNWQPLGAPFERGQKLYQALIR